MPEKEGQKNAYVCDLLHATVTINKDEGTTPMFINCPVCQKQAVSRMGRVDPSCIPTHEWYKPSEKEINRHADISAGLRNHIAKGGLLIRKITS